MGLSVTDPEFSQYKQLPFTGCVIALHGFPEEEEAHMREIATSNGESTVWHSLESIENLLLYSRET